MQSNTIEFNPVSPDGYAEIITDETGQLEFMYSKALDAHFTNRLSEIKNKLVEHGWTFGDQPTNMVKKSGLDVAAGLVFRLSKVTPNDIVGVTIEVADVKSGVIYQKQDDLSQSTEKLAIEISTAVIRQEILRSLVDDFGWTNQGSNSDLQWITKSIGGGFKGAINPNGTRRVCARVEPYQNKSILVQATFGDKILVSAALENGLAAKQQAKVLDDIINANDPNQTRDITEHYQWQRNKQGGQTFGNQQTVLPLTKALFDEHVALRVTIKDFEAYQEAYPDVTHLELIKKADGQITATGSGPLYELRPSKELLDKGWVIQVDSFDSEIAIAHGNSADQEDDESPRF